MVFAAEAGGRWRSWLVMAALVPRSWADWSCLLRQLAAAPLPLSQPLWQRTGLTPAIYTNQPLPTLSKLFPAVVSSTEVVDLPDTAQPVCCLPPSDQQHVFRGCHRQARSADAFQAPLRPFSRPIGS